jgi:hypothetical protein
MTFHNLMADEIPTSFNDYIEKYFFFSTTAPFTVLFNDYIVTHRPIVTNDSANTSRGKEYA